MEEHMAHDASAIGQGARAAGTKMSRDQIASMFERRQKAFDDLDVAAVAGDYAENCVVESPMAGVQQGRAAAQTVIRAWFDAFVDLKMRAQSLLIDGQRVAQVMAIEGTHIGPFLGMAPTGRHFQFTGVFIYELENGEIIHEHRIYDFTGLLVQIGALKAKPV
jgi:steroid delta-isomerase-like uncharacterized protein